MESDELEERNRMEDNNIFLMKRGNNTLKNSLIDLRNTLRHQVCISIETDVELPDDFGLPMISHFGIIVKWSFDSTILD